MTGILARIRAHAAERPDAPALIDECTSVSYAALAVEIEQLAALLAGDRVGVMLDNGAHWACVDLALQLRSAVCVPLPAFFSPRQLRHLVRDAGIDTIITDDTARLDAVIGCRDRRAIDVLSRTLVVSTIRRPGSLPALPPGTAKITYTSGTTGTPKGVCLDQSCIDDTAATLADAVRATANDRSLSLLPLSTLLENIGGLYAPLLAGATSQLPSLSENSSADTSVPHLQRLFATLNRHAPSTLIVVPQLLQALVQGRRAGRALPRSLRFVAVGGAPLSAALLSEARAFGIPAYQGYGLSEAGSVVCLNLPGAEREGSVGKPLGNVRVGVDADGEVVISGRLFLGYLGGDDGMPDAWPTGDLGHFDGDGYLFLDGRRKSAFATAYGRNLAPEWVERELTAQPPILQAAVFGEARPFNVAVLVTRRGSSASAIHAAVAIVNETLPGYARIAHWVEADGPFSMENALATPGGAPERAAIAVHYRDRIERLYSNEEEHVVL